MKDLHCFVSECCLIDVVYRLNFDIVSDSGSLSWSRPEKLASWVDEAKKQVIMPRWPRETTLSDLDERHGGL